MKIRNGSTCLLIHRGRVLLILRDRNPRWRFWKKISFPERHALVSGGQEETDGSPLATIAREVREELCLCISLDRFELFDIAEPLPDVVSHTYCVELTQAEVLAIRLREGQSYDFYSFKEIEELFLRGDIPQGLGGAIARLMRGKAARIARRLNKSLVLDRQRQRSTHAI